MCCRSEHGTFVCSQLIKDLEISGSFLLTAIKLRAFLATSGRIGKFYTRDPPTRLAVWCSDHRLLWISRCDMQTTIRGTLGNGAHCRTASLRSFALGPRSMLGAAVSADVRARSALPSCPRARRAVAGRPSCWDGRAIGCRSWEFVVSHLHSR